jgi:hypothetical protein
MGVVVFHVSSSSNRESIKRHGLDWRRMASAAGIAGSLEPEAAGVFLARDLDEARWFAEMGRSRHESVDIWEVTLPHDFDLDADLPNDLPYSESDGFLWTTRPIRRDQIRLHTPNA